MRRARLRALLAAGALAATGGLVVLIAPGASADLVAPYDALTLDPTGPNGLTAAALAYDDSNATIVGQAYGNGGIEIAVSDPPAHNWVALIAVPNGMTLGVGTYQTLGGADATHVGLDISGDGKACNQNSGTLNVTELTRDAGTQAITAFAANFVQRCELTGAPVYGELRVKSMVGYAAVTANEVSADFGTVVVGQTSPTTTMTLTGAGTTPTILGAGALSGAGASSFAITQDTCSGKSLGYGQTCAVTASVTPQHVGDLAATFVIPDNTAVGQRALSLAATGTSLSRGFPDSTTLDFATVPVGQTSKPQTVTISSIGSANLVLGQATVGGPDSSAFAISADTCSGKSIAPNGTCTVSVTASPTASGTQTATLLIPDNSDAKSESVALTVHAPSQIDAITDPTDINFGTVPAGQSSAGQTVTISSVGVKNVVLQQAAISGSGAGAFAITGDNCSDTTLAPNTKCTLTVKADPATTGTFSATLTIPDNTPAGARTVTLSVSSTIGAAGTYYPITPSRLMDTRIGQGAPKAPIGPGGVVHLQVTGRGGVPANGVGAVVLNVTVANPTGNSYLSLYPTGVRRPVASSLDFPKGWTGANSVTVAVGAGGKVDIYNLTGNTPTIVDVLGFYASSDAVLATNGLGGQFQPLLPSRLLDTRKEGGALPSRFVVTVPIDFGDDINSHIRAFAVNITAVTPGSQGFLSAWNGIGAPPKRRRSTSPRARP